MASLVLGIAGAVLGSFVGQPALGFMAGSLLGNLLFPAKSETPELTDRKMQVASYGVDIPIIYGTWRLSGICDWQTELIPHTQGGGGKGSSEPQTTTYTASFSMLLCKNVILGVIRRWAGGRLIAAQGNSANWPFVLYLGTTTQLPDPTIEAAVGAGKVTGNRGKAYEVVTDKDMTEFGNALPLMDYEVYTNAGTFPWRVSAFNTMPDDVGGHKRRVVTYANGVVTIGLYDTTSFANGHYYERQFDINGVEDVAAAYNATITPNGFPSLPVSNLLAATDDSAWFVRENLAVVINAGAPFNVSGLNRAYINDYIFALGGNPGTGHAGVTRWPAAGGVISTLTATYDQAVDLGLADGSVGNPSLSGFVLGTTNRTDCVYVGKTNGATKTLFEYSFDLQTLNRQWDLSAANLIESVLNGAGFTVYENSNGQLILACDRGGTGFKNAGAFYLNANLSVTFIGQVNATNTIGTTIGNVAMLGTSGYALVDDGIISLDPPPAPVILGDIVADICRRCGLQPGEYDTSDLTDLVDGFMIAAQMTGVNAINALRQAYSFDGCEIDGVLVFKKRGGAPQPAIPDEDLCAHEYGSEPPAPFHIIRTDPYELPRRVDVKYVDKDLDYQQGSQGAERQVTESQNDVTVELPIVMTATKARGIATTRLFEAHIEKERFVFFTWRKWAHYMPMDVVPVYGRTVRINNKTELPNGKIQFDAVPVLNSIYVQTAPGAPSTGFPPQNPPGTVIATEMELLDLPMLSDSDFERGMRIAMGPISNGSWPGASAFKSTSGTTYNSVATKVAPDVIGICTTVLPNWLGGNTFDESSILDVTLTDDDATLTSYSSDEVLNGAGLYLVGLEIVQAKNAALTGIKAGRLSGFLRGRRGTEWAMAGHGPNERFVALPVTNVDMAVGELFQNRLYKGVTFGATLASATAQTFANMGQAARPLSPSYVGGGTDASGNHTFNWLPRTRIGGDWQDFHSPIGETTEAYVVQIWNTARTLVARVITGVTSPTTTYSAADELADFGAMQQTITFSVGLLGAYQLGTQTFAVVPSTGGSNNDPLVPVPPYNSPSIPGSGGGGAVNVVLSWPSDMEITAGYVIGDTYVAEFTTGASVPTSGYIATAEYADPAYFRHVRLCTDAAGLNLVPNGEQYGNSTSITFGTGNAILAALTTYYFVIRTELGNGSPSGPLGSPAQMRVNLFGVP